MAKRRRAFGRIAKWKGRWCARWLEDGKLRQKSFTGSKALAQRFLAQKQLELEEQEAAGDAPLLRIRFRDLFETYEAMFKGQKAESTIRREEQYLRSKALPYFGKMWMDEIQRADVERWLMQRMAQDKISGATRSRLLGMLSRFLRQAVALGHARDNPAAGVVRHKEHLKPVPYLDVAAQARLIQATRPRIRPLVTLLLDTGMRLGEALRFVWADVDFERGTILIRTSKNRTPREVAFTTRGRNALTAAMGDEGEPSDPQAAVFADITHRNSNGELRLLTTARYDWHQTRKAAGYPKLTIHDLRHVFAVTAARAGVPLGELQMILGHKTPSMTLRYARHCPSNTPELARDRLASYLGGA